jgi:hypothetical protein
VRRTADVRCSIDAHMLVAYSCSSRVMQRVTEASAICYGRAAACACGLPTGAVSGSCNSDVLAAGTGHGMLLLTRGAAAACMHFLHLHESEASL